VIRAKEYAFDFIKTRKNLTSIAKQGLVTTFIDLFWISMGKDGSVSYPESKV
jgi:hypothetical protein